MRPKRVKTMIPRPAPALIGQRATTRPLWKFPSGAVVVELVNDKAKTSELKGCQKSYMWTID